jgi:diguanylate cyclase (GGDEF)-like protein
MGKSLAYCLKALKIPPAEAAYLTRRAKAYVVDQGMSQGEADSTVANEWIAEQEAEYNQVLRQINAAVAKAPEQERRIGSARTRQMYESIAAKVKDPEEAREIIRELINKLYTDELMGIGTRAGFFEELAKDEQLDPKDRRLVIMADLDNFSWFNDALGHQVGDKVLREVGAILQEQPVPAYRLGGEEIGLLIKGESSARAVAETIRGQAENDIRVEFTINQPRTLKDGTAYKRGDRISVSGIGVSYGIGDQYSTADERLQDEKEERERQGIRSPKGAEAQRVRHRGAFGARPGAKGERQPPASFPEDVATFSVKVRGELENVMAVPSVAKKIIDRFYKGSEYGLEPVLRKQMGRKPVDEMSYGEKLKEVRSEIKRDVEVSVEEIRTSADPLEYLIDRALDPLDEKNEFWAEVLRRITGGQVVAGRSYKPAEVKTVDSDNIYSPESWKPIAKIGEAATAAAKSVSFKQPTRQSDIEGLQASATTRMVTTGSLKAKNLYARTPAEAASLMAHIRKHAQENLYLVAVNEKGKILEIHRYVKGTSRAAPAEVASMAGYAMNTGAARVYAAHNHPSQDPTASAQDIELMRAIDVALNLADIELVPIVIGGTKYVVINAGATSTTTAPESIPAAVRKKKLNIRERVFGLNKPGPAVNNSQHAISVKKDLFGADAEGFLLLNAQNQVLGFYEYPKGLTVKQGAVEILKVLEKTSAQAMIFFTEAAPGPAGDKHLQKKIDSRTDFIRGLKGALGSDVALHDYIASGISQRDQNALPDLWQSTVGGDYGKLNKDEVLLSTKKAAALKSVMEAKPSSEELDRRIEQGIDLMSVAEASNPQIFFDAKRRYAEKKWKDMPFHETRFFIVNNRLARELQIFEILFGPSEHAIEVPGAGRKPARSIVPSDLLTDIYRVVESGEAHELLNEKYNLEEMAKARGLSFRSPGKDEAGNRIKSAGETFVKFGQFLRKGNLLVPVDEAGKPLLTKNAKAIRSADFLLATCDPTEQCIVCYAASNMLRQDTINKAFRNQLAILMDPDKWAVRLANEARKMKRPELLFIRLQGSGDLTTIEQIKGYNKLAKVADRPIHIFSRHHEMLRELISTAAAPFLRMGSLDQMLYGVYGHDFLVENMHKHGISNAFLFTSLEEVATMEALQKDKALGLILAAEKELHYALENPKLREISCPCDAGERHFISSCRQCALSQRGCMTAFREFGVDTKGKLWSIKDPKLPKKISPILTFLSGADPMSLGEFIMKKHGPGTRSRKEKLALVARAKRELGLDPNNIMLEPTIQGYLVSAIEIIRDSMKKLRKQMEAFKKGNKSDILLYDLREQSQGRATDYKTAQEHYDFLQWVHDQAVMAHAFLRGGEIQAPIAIKAGQQLADGRLINPEDAKLLQFSVKSRGNDAAYNNEDIRVANKSDQVASSERLSEAVPQAVAAIASSGDRILDYGAGKPNEDGQLPHLDQLRKLGAQVTAYDFGENLDPDAHDANALERKYDIVAASNVLNVQNSPSSFNTTMAQLVAATSRKGGRLVVNMPAGSREGFLQRMSHKTALRLVRAQLREHFADVRQAEGKRDVLIASQKRQVPLSEKSSAARLRSNPVFVQWFGDSKVVDKKGNPRVVYHGTDSVDDFTRFRRSLRDIGIHFGTKEQANDRLAYKSRLDMSGVMGQRIYPVFLKIEKPLRVDDPGAWDVYNMPLALKQTGIFKQEELQELAEYESILYRAEQEEIYDDESFRDDAVEAIHVEFTDKVRDLLEKHGYDGIVYQNTGEIEGMAAVMAELDSIPLQAGTKEEKDKRRSETYARKKALEESDKVQDSYVVFEPTQIKSVFNRGTFNTTNADIMFSAKQAGWYSQMRNVLAKKLPNKSTRENMYKMIKAWAGKEFKAEELEWSTLPEELERPTVIDPLFPGFKPKGAGGGKITKEEVLDILDSGSLYLEEEVLSTADSADRRSSVIYYLEDDWDDYSSALLNRGIITQKEFTELQERYDEAVTFYVEQIDSSALDELLQEVEELYENQSVIDSDFPEIYPLSYYEQNSQDDSDFEEGEGGAQYADYQVEGGDRYTELIMSLNPTLVSRTDKEWKEFNDLEYEIELAKELIKDIERDLRSIAERDDTFTANITRNRSFLDEWVSEATRSSAAWREAAPLLAQKQKLEAGLEHNMAKLEGMPEYSGRQIGSFEPTQGYDHWSNRGLDTKNPILHVRFNERYDVNGKRVLFIEEIQSDWHEQGHKYGYADPAKMITDEEYVLKYYNEKIYGTVSNTQFKDLPEGAQEIYRREALETKQEYDEAAVPEAPWKGANTWMMLGFKRMVRWAAIHGFDRIAWTPGHIQAQRYRLGTYTDRVVVEKIDGIEEVGTEVFKVKDRYKVKVRTRQEGAWKDVGTFKENELEGVIGKELARKVFNDPGAWELRDPERATWTFSGSDLHIGGAGMKIFYDKMLTNNVNRMFNKKSWGNAKVHRIVVSYSPGLEEVDVPSHDQIVSQIEEVETGVFKIKKSDDTDSRFYAGGYTSLTFDSYQDVYETVLHAFLEFEGYRKPLSVSAIDVTDKMRQKAIEGMPLFSAKPSRLQPARVSALYREQLEAVATAEALEALSIRETGVPFYHEFLERHSDDDVPLRVLRRQYTDLYGPPEQFRIGDELVAIGKRKFSPMFSAKKGIESNPQLRPVVDQYIKMLEATMPPEAGENDMAENVLDALDEQTRKRIEQPGGLKEPPVVERIRKLVSEAKNTFTRSYAELDPKNYGSVLNVLRLHQEVGENAARRAGSVITNILHGLKPKQYTAFRMALIMDDMIKDIDSGLLRPDAEKDESYPFGFKTEAEVRAYHKYVTDQANGDRLVASALARRDLFNRRLKQLLVKHHILDEKVLEDDRYFHHQVLKYRALTSEGDQYYLGAGLSQRRLEYRKKGWQLARTGSLADYNTDYAQAEYEVIAQAFLQLETLGSLNRIKNIADYTERAKELAKSHERETGEKREWKEFLPEGYVPWKPAIGSVWYKATTITDRMIDKIASGDIAIGEAKMREVWLKGKDPEWYIPNDLARTLDNYGKTVADNHWMAKWSAKFLGRWKQWTLINPMRVVKYNMNNFSGDMDIAFAYDPRLQGAYFGAAMRDLVREYRSKGKVTWTEKALRSVKWGRPKAISDEIKKELELARRLGVIGSGWSVQELSELSQSLTYEEALEAFSDPSMFQRIGRGLKHTFWTRPKNITALRENILRLAAWRFFKDQIAAGATVYGASRRSEVDAIEDLDEKAAKLGRDLIGDYGNISDAGQWLRRHMIPFYSWLEVNAPRYVRLIANMKHEGKSTKLIPVALGKKATWKTAALGIKMVSFMALVNLWNMTFFSDEEKELPEQQRRQMHLILGRRSDGSIRTLRIQGAFSDALAWFGGEDLPQDVRDLAKGRTAPGEWITETAKAPVRKYFQGLRPGPKLLYTLASGQSFYPEGPFESRPVRDQVGEIFRLFSLERPYRIVSGKPRRGSTAAERLWFDITSMAFYNNDPGEMAYYQTISWTFEFMEKVDEGIGGSSYSPSDKSNAMYYYRQALKYGDLPSAERYLKKYVELGGTQKGMTQSIARAHPLNRVTSKYRDQFRGMLSPHQMQVLELAEQWYHRTYKSGLARELPWPKVERKPKTLNEMRLGE